MTTNRSTTPTTYSSQGRKPSSKATPKIHPSDFVQAPIIDFCNASLEDCIRELPFDDAYYIKNYGLDRRNYLIYQEMVAHTEKFCDAYLDAEMNGTNGYQPFFV